MWPHTFIEDWTSRSDKYISGCFTTHYFFRETATIHSISSNISLENIPLHFRLILQGEGTYQKKLHVKTFPFPSTNGGHQRYNGQRSHLSRPLSFQKGVLKSHLFYIIQRYSFKIQVSIIFEFETKSECLRLEIPGILERFSLGPKCSEVECQPLAAQI